MRKLQCLSRGGIANRNPHVEEEDKDEEDDTEMPKLGRRRTKRYVVRILVKVVNTFSYFSVFQDNK